MKTLNIRGHQVTFDIEEILADTIDVSFTCDGLYSEENANCFSIAEIRGILHALLEELGRHHKGRIAIYSPTGGRRERIYKCLLERRGVEVKTGWGGDDDWKYFSIP